MKKNDIEFDYRKDSKCGDPDADSILLYKAHQKLWSKPLPSGQSFELELNTKFGKSRRLLLKNNKLMDNFSSDRLCPHFDGKYGGRFDGWMSSSKAEELKYKVRTLGGHIIFPAHRRNGFTINQARGVSRVICDRFDLTLECIRRFYKDEHSPLYTTLKRYKDFFELFIDFQNYIEFFLLQDFLDLKGKIKFSLPFDDFNRSPLPQTAEEYELYRLNTITVMDERNKRILLAV